MRQQVHGVFRLKSKFVAWKSEQWGGRSQEVGRGQWWSCCVTDSFDLLWALTDVSPQNKSPLVNESLKKCLNTKDGEFLNFLFLPACSRLHWAATFHEQVSSDEGHTASWLLFYSFTKISPTERLISERVHKGLNNFKPALKNPSLTQQLSLRVKPPVSTMAEHPQVHHAFLSYPDVIAHQTAVFVTMATSNNNHINNNFIWGRLSKVTLQREEDINKTVD